MGPGGVPWTKGGSGNPIYEATFPCWVTLSIDAIRAPQFVSVHTIVVIEWRLEDCARWNERKSLRGLDVYRSIIFPDLLATDRIVDHRHLMGRSWDG